MKHRPVLLKEVLLGFKPIKEGLIVDSTFGRGGHALGILSNQEEYTHSFTPILYP